MKRCSLYDPTHSPGQLRYKIKLSRRGAIRPHFEYTQEYLAGVRERAMKGLCAHTPYASAATFSGPQHSRALSDLLLLIKAQSNCSYKKKDILYLMVCYGLLGRGRAERLAPSLRALNSSDPRLKVEPTAVTRLDNERTGRRPRRVTRLREVPRESEWGASFVLYTNRVIVLMKVTLTGIIQQCFSNLGFLQQMYVNVVRKECVRSFLSTSLSSS